MKGRNIITINGRLYDALTGMPLPQAQAAAAKKPASAQAASVKPTPKHAPKTARVFNDFAKPVAKVAKPAAKPQAQAAAQPKPATHPATPQSTAHLVHQKPQRSQTLHRAALKRPATKPAAHKPAKPTVHRSPVISKWGSLYDSAEAAQQAEAANRAEQQAQAQAQTQHPQPQYAKPHPVVAKALENIDQAQAPVKPAPAQSSKELKEMLIKERLAQVDTADKNKEKKRRSFFGGQKRLTTILTSSLAILLLGGYLTYINLPNISMRVAATRAGVAAANFPSYKPDGYSFEGPITYSPGEIAINFNSNTNDQSYTVKQKTSNWDSQAVLDNFVTKHTDSYLTYQERGLTIFSFDNKAAWVNGGLLYTIEGNAKLNGEQILRIATSM